MHCAGSLIRQLKQYQVSILTQTYDFQIFKINGSQITCSERITCCKHFKKEIHARISQDWFVSTHKKGKYSLNIHHKVFAQLHWQASIAHLFTIDVVQKIICHATKANAIIRSLRPWLQGINYVAAACILI